MPWNGLEATSVEVVRWEPLEEYGNATKQPEALAGTRNGLYHSADMHVTWAKVADAEVGNRTVQAVAGGPWASDVVDVAGAASSAAACAATRSTRPCRASRCAARPR